MPLWDPLHLMLWLLQDSASSLLQLRLGAAALTTE